MFIVKETHSCKRTIETSSYSRSGQHPHSQVKSVSVFLHWDAHPAQTQSSIPLISAKMLYNSEPSVISGLCCPPANQPISTWNRSWTPTNFAHGPIRELLQLDAILSVHSSRGWGILLAAGWNLLLRSSVLCNGRVSYPIVLRVHSN